MSMRGQFAQKTIDLVAQDRNEWIIHRHHRIGRSNS